MSGEEITFSNNENVLSRRNTKALDAEQEKQGSRRIKQDIVRSVVAIIMESEADTIKDGY